MLTAAKSPAESSVALRAKQNESIQNKPNRSWRCCTLSESDCVYVTSVCDATKLTNARANHSDKNGRIRMYVNPVTSPDTDATAVQFDSKRWCMSCSETACASTRFSHVSEFAFLARRRAHEYSSSSSHMPTTARRPHGHIFI